jgi:hypothetical protein
VRSRHIEALDAAARAKQVPRRAGAPAIIAEHIAALHQREIIGTGDQVQITGLAADRTVAIEQFRRIGEPHPECDPPAMAATCCFAHRHATICRHQRLGIKPVSA